MYNEKLNEFVSSIEKAERDLDNLIKKAVEVEKLSNISSNDIQLVVENWSQQLKDYKKRIKRYKEQVNNLNKIENLKKVAKKAVEINEAILEEYDWQQDLARENGLIEVKVYNDQALRVELDQEPQYFIYDPFTDEIEQEDVAPIEYWGEEILREFVVAFSFQHPEEYQKVVEELD